MCRGWRVRTVDPMQDHFEDDDRRTLHLRLDVRLDCEPIRGCLRATWGAEERFEGWLGFADALQRMQERHGAGPERAPTD